MKIASSIVRALKSYNYLKWTWLTSLATIHAVMLFIGRRCTLTFEMQRFAPTYCFPKGPIQQINTQIYYILPFVCIVSTALYFWRYDSILCAIYNMKAVGTFWLQPVDVMFLFLVTKLSQIDLIRN